MNRTQLHTLETAPAASRPVLQRVIDASPGVGVLNLWAVMAESPATLDAYMAIRESIEAHATFDPGTRSAIALAAAASTDGAYSTSINRRIATRAGQTPEQIEAVRSATVNDPRQRALLELVREAAAHRGTVPDSTWQAALDAGWTTAHLVEAFAVVALTWYVDGFATFANVPLDSVPTGKPNVADREAVAIGR
jgi:alkylhydroperoxidase family enzyme